MLQLRLARKSEIGDNRSVVAQLAHKGIVPDRAVEHLLACREIAEDMVELVGVATLTQKGPLLALGFMTLEPAAIGAAAEELG